MSANILIDVGLPNNRGRRLVIARYNGGEHRDTISTDSARSRKSFIARLAAKLSMPLDDLKHLEDDIIAAADTADAAIDFGEDRQREENGRKPQSTRLVELAAEDELFHDAERNAYASLLINECRQTWPVRSQQYRDYLRRRFFAETQHVPNSQAVKDALADLEGKAVLEGRQEAVWLRVAQQGSGIYLDVANERWEAVEITPTGWRIVSNPPVRFRRTKRMQPLPHPVQGGNIEELWNFLNLGIDDDQLNQWLLLVGWLLMAMRPTGPYPVLCLYGEQGSAKSTAARMLRSLVDPNTSPLRAEPRDTRDLAIAGSNQWCLSLDNLSRIPVWLSDALCRLATGGGFSTRELYTDGEEYVFDGQRPVVLNGITEIATRSDLMDRALVVTLPVIPDEKRRPEAELWRAFEEARPRILGALLDGAAAALRNLPSTSLPALPRMADFALWVTAAESAFPWPQGSFLKAYNANRADANVAVLETSPVVKALDDLLASVGPSWEGTASELLKELGADEQTKRLDDWPKTASSLSNTLHRLAPNLRRAGVNVVFRRTSKRKFIVIEKRLDSPVTAVTTVTTNGTPTLPAAKSPRPRVTADHQAGDGLVLADDGLVLADDEWPDVGDGQNNGEVPAR
jgi:hypothetical protein